MIPVKCGIYEYVFSQYFPRQVPVYASSNPCSHGFMLGANMVSIVRSCCNVWSYLSTMFCQPSCLSTQICPHMVTCQHNMFNVNRIVFCRFFLERIDQWVMSVPLQQQSPKWLGQTHSTPSGGCRQKERERVTVIGGVVVAGFNMYQQCTRRRGSI